MKNKLLLFFFVGITFNALAQEKETEARGTIKVQKTGQLVKVLFDDVNYRLIGIDQYGNPMDSAVVEFQMQVRVKGLFHGESAKGNTLSREMQLLLNTRDQATKIYFDKIKAKDRSGRIVDMPKFSYSFDSRNDDSY